MEWPDEYAELRSLLCEEGILGDRSVELAERFTDGKSGADVFLASAALKSGFLGDAVLKIHSHPAGDLVDLEAANYESAVAFNPSFADRHLAAVLLSVSTDAHTATLYRVAGDSLNNCAPVYLTERTASFEEGLAYTIGLELLAWNTDAGVAASECDARDLLRQWLGHRLDPATSRLLELLESRGIDPYTHNLFVRGATVPNPIAYALGDLSWPGRATRAQLGAVHGDLNCANLIVNLLDLSDYYLIDLDSFSPGLPLLFDHAYLELSYLLRRRSGAAVDRWLTILGCIGDRPVLGVNLDSALQEDAGLVRVVSSLRKSIESTIGSRWSSRRDHLEQQAVLARVAAGLNFANKRLDEDSRVMAFLYACQALGQYFALVTQGQWVPDEPGAPLFGGTSHASGQWRQVWDEFNGFDEHHADYVLVAGPGVHDASSETRELIGRLPWSLVIDLDSKTRSGGLMEATEAVGTRLRRPLRPITELNPDDKVNLGTALPWVVCMPLGTSQLQADYEQWRLKFVPQIRRRCDSLLRASRPRPIKVLFMTAGLDGDVERSVWESVSEAFNDHAVYVTLAPANVTPGAGLASRSTVFQAEYDEFGAGLCVMLGEAVADGRVSVPARNAEKQRCRVYVSPTLLSSLREYFDLVHPGLAASESASDPRDFYSGHEITWSDLQVATDVPREFSDRFVERVREDARYTNPTVNLLHTPGAGGTTVALRVAWRLKDEYPTLVMRRGAQDMTEAARRLNDLSLLAGRLPLLVIVEAQFLADEQREQLYRLLKARQCRTILVYVKRVIRSRRGTTHEDVLDLMSPNECTAFVARYSRDAEPARHRAIEEVAQSDDWADYRLPFFFGLAAFGDEYQRIPDFVQAHLPEDIGGADRIMKYLALVTRYSQEALLTEEVTGLAGLSDDKAEQPLSEILGEAAARLVISRDDEVRIMHPLIADEVLKQLLKRDLPAGSDHTQGLADLSCAFIRDLVGLTSEDSDHAKRLLTQLFIDRRWDESTERRPRFSELVLAIQDKFAQGSVFRQLTESCENDAHFWNHRARHEYDRLLASFDVSYASIEEALRLEPDESVHWHTAGMIYRREAKRVAEADYGRRGEDRLAKAFQLMRPEFDGASEAFSKTRQYDPENTYGYISHIQMVWECFDALKKAGSLAYHRDLLARLDEIGEWCRQELSHAEWLLDEVRSIERLQDNQPDAAQDGGKDYYGDCVRDIKKIYGDFDALLRSLSALMERPGVFQPAVRRSIADALLLRSPQSWSTLPTDDCERICDLLQRSLEGPDWNAHDVKTWFEAYRRLDRFSLYTAIDRVGRWTLREQTLTGEFYMFILHFVQWLTGLTRDGEFAIEHLGRLQRLSQNRGLRTFNFEWLTNFGELPVRPSREIAPWEDGFFTDESRLLRVAGFIADFTSTGSGALVAVEALDGGVGPFRAFYPLTPGGEVLDKLTPVSCYLGFTYDGLRAWKVESRQPSPAE